MRDTPPGGRRGLSITLLDVGTNMLCWNQLQKVSHPHFCRIRFALTIQNALKSSGLGL
jgi:hypothetical protein